MTTQYIARAFDGTRWVHRLETESLEEAIHNAREFMDILHGTDAAWLLIEVATTDGYATVVRQWVDCKSGYCAVLGRDGKS